MLRGTCDPQAADNVECIGVCDVLPWPDCGRPSNAFTHPASSESVKTPKPTHFRV